MNSRFISRVTMNQAHSCRFRLLSHFLCALALCAVGACSSVEPEAPIDESIPDEPLFLLLDAYKGNQQYFLRYRRGDSVYYAAGDLASSAQLDTDGQRDEYNVPVIVPMDEHEQDPWVELTRNLTPIPILDVADWALLRQRLFGSLMPTAKNTGIAVSFDRMDYFFFYDNAGNFRVRRLIDKPPWYSVSDHVNLREHFTEWQPRLDTFLAEQGIQGEDLIFNTGDLDKGSIPFLYINTRTKLIVLVQYEDLSHTPVADLPGMHILQSFWHFLGSHTYTVLMRPFSTVQSLLAVVTDTAAETGRGLAAGLRFYGPVRPLANAEPMDLVAWEQQLDAHLDRESSRGTLTFLVDGDGFFPRFIDTLTSAQESIDIRAYIFDNDDVALQVGELLKRRSREGVEVRVLFDGLGTAGAAGAISETQPDEHRPPLSIATYLGENSNVQVRKTNNTWMVGDHVKTMVIDRSIAFLGGMNIGREYRYDWHDMMVEVTGPVVDDINHEFKIAWGRAGFFGDFSTPFLSRRESDNAALDGYPVRLIHTRPGAHEIYDVQRMAIQRARSYIYIENAYFTDDTLLRDLIAARQRGVDVRVIIPLETDRGIITRNIMLAANILIERGVRVYIYPGFSHAKAAVFDGWAMVGSANLDRLSLHINREINIATSEPEAVEGLLTALFEPDFEKSRELLEPFPERWTDRIIEMFGDYVF